MKKYLSALAAALMLTGCIHFSYDGRKLDEPSKEVTLFEQNQKIEYPYDVLGTAKVSADYDNVSRDRMEQKLLDRAMEYGADAVLITGEKVALEDTDVPMRSDFSIPGFSDSENSSTSAVRRDFQSYQGDGPTTNLYRRILTAEFIKYKSDKP